MAEVLSDFDWDHSRSGSRYDSFMDGQIWRIDLGEPAFAHFAHLDSARTALSQRARMLGLMFRTRKIDNETLVFQVTGHREA